MVRMLVAEYGTEGTADWRRVVVDPTAGVVTFYHCHQPNRFLAWGADPQFTCLLSELRGINWSYHRYIGRLLVVVTPAGLARLPERATAFEEVRAALLDGLAPGARLRWYESPIAKVTLLLALILPFGVLGAGLVAMADQVVPGWLPIAVLLGLMLLLILIPLAAWWRGKSLW